MLEEVIFLEGVDIRKITGDVEWEEDFIVVTTLNKVFRINKRYIIKVESPLPKQYQ